MSPYFPDMKDQMLKLLQMAGCAVRDKVFAELQQNSIEKLSEVYKESEDDTIYQIDRNVEEILVPLLEPEAKQMGGIWLLAEGIGDPEKGLVLGAKAGADPAWAIIMDPIDGTRGIMYDKRSAFFLAGAAPYKSGLKLSDIEVACMVELPTSKMMVADMLWAIKGQGAKGQRFHLLHKTWAPLVFKPTQAKTLLGGFGQIARFFPPGREILARIDDALVNRLYPNAAEGKTLVFEDQYISSGGQMYEILMGHDRYVADIRDVLFQKMSKEGLKKGHICHPYDICVFLIGREAGVEFTDSRGMPLDAGFDLLEEVGWIAYANSQIRSLVEPVLLDIMHKEDLI